MSSQARIRKGIAAHAATLVTRIAVQFVTLPVFFASWSADRVGTWLLLFAIPAYVAIAATGFAAAGGNSALAAMQAGDKEQAAADFHASWLVTTIATGVLALLFFIGMAAVVPQMSGLDLLSASEGTATLAWLALYIFAVSQTMIAEIPFRAAGKYPEYIASFNAASLVEIVVIALSVVTSDSFATLAMALALSRGAGALLIFRLGKNYAPELFRRSGKPLRESFRPLVKPSLAFMLAPLIFGINLQGFVLVLGLSVGAAALAGFVATRTLTRIIDLYTNFTYASQFYESGHFDGPKEDIQRRLLATMTLVSLLACLALSAFLLGVGPWLQDFYTLGQTSFDPLVAAILLAAATLRALAASPTAILAAANLHSRYMTAYLAGSAIALGLALLLARSGASLPVVIVPLLLSEASQLVPAMRDAMRVLAITPAQFLRMLASRQRLADIRALLNQLRRSR
ncbi:hypothetical protein GRI42_08960 [Erythrobacter gaetbuli]|uniref:Oligosaccharide flippase family protein n=1 Tax=Qipengyuania gaetbuli TaxID=266952 RepID=A0A844XZF8_9SPHN|nr:hypothetical protein [Qipengyuania gaetbuli]MXO51430.1 hypothetical protein [Qipengyuania gaetbuli]